MDHTIGGDARYRFDDLDNLLRHGDWKPLKAEASGFSAIGPLVSSPLYYLDRAYGQPETFLPLFNVLLLGAAVLALRLVFSGAILQRLTLLILLGSMFPHHISTYYAETFSALAMGAGILLIAHERFALGTVFVSLGAANTPALLVPLGLLCAYEGWRERRLRYALPAFIAACLYLGEAWLRRGNPFSTFYLERMPAKTLMPYSGEAGFSYPLFFGLLSILLSFGKGLVFYTPGAFLKPLQLVALSEPIQRAYRMSVVFLLGMVLLYAKWWAWSGDWFWGPRFFLFACLPASLSLALRIGASDTKPQDDALTLVAVVLSIWVGVNGILFSTNQMDLCTHNDGRLGAYCHYTGEFSALWRPFVTRPFIGGRTLMSLAFGMWVAVYLSRPVINRLVQAMKPRAIYHLRTALQRWRW